MRLGSSHDALPAQHRQSAVNLQTIRSGKSAVKAAPAFELAFSAAAGKSYIPFLSHNLHAARRLLKIPLNQISVALVGDRRMSALHQEFMGIDSPTDVLTFPLEFDRRGRVTGGEIIVCVPEAMRQARRLKTLPQRELVLYALHGMLHLAGFDDRTESGFRIMHRTEDRILTRLGLGPQFARTPNPARDPGARQ